ncbi:hypothetical protein [Nostoc sp.]|uniref:hypothetical protein n=1 Tax=Nostoc sp. TaxID=1180 RepID=UPI002FFD3E61
MPDSEDPKQVSSNDLRNSQFGGGFINAESVNNIKLMGILMSAGKTKFCHKCIDSDYELYPHHSRISN